MRQLKIGVPGVLDVPSEHRLRLCSSYRFALGNPCGWTFPLGDFLNETHLQSARAATGKSWLEAGARLHFQNESEDSEHRTTPDQAGSSRMAASIELSTRLDVSYKAPYTNLSAGIRLC